MSKKRKQPIPTAKKQKAAKPQAPLVLADNGLKKVLHVGCGPKSKKDLPKTFQGDDWQEIRLDIDPSAKPDIVSDIMEMKPVANDSVDAVFSSHNVEHVYAFQVQKVLSEFFRVIKPGGFAYITCPDLQAVAFHIAQGKFEAPLYQSPAGPITAQDILYGHGASMQRGQFYMAHKCGFTAESLGLRMQAAGFRDVVVERDQYLNLWARGIKVAKGDPREKDDRIRLRGGYKHVVVPAPDALPNKMPDELDIPPKLWKPLGLKKTA